MYMAVQKSYLDLCSDITTWQQEGILYAHTSISSVEVPQRHFCELFTFTTSICGLFSGVEWRILGVTFNKCVLEGIEAFLQWKSVFCSLAVALERSVFPFIVSGIQWLIKCPFCLEAAFSPFCWLVYLKILPFSPY